MEKIYSTVFHRKELAIHVWKKCSKVGHKCSFLVTNAQF